MYTTEFAEIYEPMYRLRGKDWQAEAGDVVALVRDLNPGAGSLLDVACGTGAHLEHFAGLLDHVEGVEIAPSMRALAAARIPDVAVHDGDMRDFRLGRTFDAVTCLFNSVGYLGDVAELRAAIGSMALHLAPGGVLVVDPWWTPDTFVDGYLAADSGQIDGRALARVSHSTRDGRATRLHARFLVGDAGGVREFSLVHELTLFTESEYLDAFAAAGCPARRTTSPLSGRGLYVARREQ